MMMTVMMKMMIPTQQSDQPKYDVKDKDSGSDNDKDNQPWSL